WSTLTMPGNPNADAMEDIDEMEDDVGEEDESEGEEGSPLVGGAKAKVASWTGTAKTVAGVGNTIAQQGVGAVGKVAYGMNYAATGSIFTAAHTGASAAMVGVVAVTGPIGIALACVESAFSAY